MTREAAAEYRRLAQGCLELAQHLLTEEAHLALIVMASNWLRLAEQQDRKVANITAPPSPTEHAQPVTQQQQQVQPKDEKE